MLIKRKQGVNRTARQQSVSQKLRFMAFMTMYARQNCLLFHALDLIFYTYFARFQTSNSCLDPVLFP